LQGNKFNTEENQVEPTDVKPYYGILKARFISFSLSSLFFSFAVEMFDGEQTVALFLLRWKCLMVSEQ